VAIKTAIRRSMLVPHIPPMMYCSLINVNQNHQKDTTESTIQTTLGTRHGTKKKKAKQTKKKQTKKQNKNKQTNNKKTQNKTE